MNVPLDGLGLALGVGAAGGLGAVLRVLVDTWVTAHASRRFPWGIVVVNVTGSFGIGVVAGTLGSGGLATVLATGLLGGYTTFSTASLDSARLALRGRGGAAVAHAVGLAAMCVLAAAAGMAVG